MFQLIIQWLLSAIALMIVSQVVPGFYVEGLWPAMIAAVVIGLLNATLGVMLKVITFPLVVVTLGVFLLFINGVMILMASRFVDGFYVSGIMPAFWGAAVMALLSMAFRVLMKKG